MIGLAVVVFIKLFYGSQTFSQAILLCLRTILIISSLLKYVELIHALSSIHVLVLTYLNLWFTWYKCLFITFMILMIYISYTDPGIFLIDPNENKRFTLWVIYILVSILVSSFFNLSPLKAGFILSTFWGLQFASLSILYDIYDIFILLLLFIVILNIENYFKIIRQPVFNNRTIGTQNDWRELIRSTNGLTITECCIHAFMQIYLMQ